MGLDGTIKRRWWRALGRREDVQRAIQAAFPGTEFGRSLSGLERVKAAADKGLAYPQAVRDVVVKLPAEFQGIFEGPSFIIEFFLGTDEIVQRVEFRFYGDAGDADPFFTKLAQDTGWVVSHP